MSDRAYAKVPAQQKLLIGSSPKSSLLQRTCACGQHTIAGGECEACRNERLTLHRSQRAFGPLSASTVSQGRSSAQENSRSLNTVVDRASRFGHDFSRIPIHSTQTAVPQTKLKINHPGDVYEQEANQVAEQVMRMTDLGPFVSDDEDETKTSLMRKQSSEPQADTVADISSVPLAVHTVLNSGGGQPLDTTTRNFMEPRFGHDFSGVRVYTDAQAAKSARAVNALAYTAGQNVVFGAGQHAPRTNAGLRLLAHELTHVVQQSGGQSLGIQRQAAEAPTRLITHTELAANLERERNKRTGRDGAKGPVRFRLPLTSDLKALYKSGNVPEKVLKDSIEMALTRMAKDGRLKTSDPVPDIMKKVFPAPGVFDEKEYEKAVDVGDRSKIYQSVLDAETKVTSADKPKLTATMTDAGKLIDQSAADAVNLKLVFGSKDSVAKTIYGKAKAALTKAITNIDTAITTDYNLDDPEIGLGGWARFAEQKVHFQPGVVKVVDVNGAKVTIIHEASHLADPSVRDKGYYKGDGFESMSEDEKVTNAAHFEEIPRRKLGTSRFKVDQEFKPGQTVAGAPVTFEDKVRRRAAEYLRKAWDKAVDVHMFLRRIRNEILGGSKASFNANKVRIMEISKLMHLTIHQQPAATATINQVDIVLAEGVAHGTTKIKAEAPKQSVPAIPPIVMIDPEAVYAQQVEEDSIKAYNALTGNFADDKKLMDWLVAEFKKPF